MTENRREPRLYRRFILHAASFDEKPLRWSFVTILNLSSSGVYFTYDRRAYPGMLMHLKIDFPDRLIECMGRVVRVTGQKDISHHDVAARLEGVEPDARVYIESFVRQNLAI